MNRDSFARPAVMGQLGEGAEEVGLRHDPHEVPSAENRVGAHLVVTHPVTDILHPIVGVAGHRVHGHLVGHPVLLKLHHH